MLPGIKKRVAGITTLFSIDFLLHIFIEELPKSVFQWRLCSDGDGFLGHRVFETDQSGMQADAASFVGAGKTVFQISFDRTADFCQLTADLMVTAGV